MTISMHDDVHVELQQLADAQGITITELVKRSVARNRFVWEHQDGRLLVNDKGKLWTFDLRSDKHNR